MEGIIKLLNVGLPVLYFYTTYLYAIFFFREQQPAGIKATRMLYTTIAIHIIEIILRVFGDSPSSGINLCLCGVSLRK